jgi:lysophospholipase L1-like esterase
MTNDERNPNDQFRRAEIVSPFRILDFFRHSLLVIRHLAFVIVLFTLALTGHAAAPLKLDFSSSKPPPGFVQVLPTTTYSTNVGYGFDLGSKVTSTARGCTSDQPFFFSVALPEGNYRVSVKLGSPTNETRTTVKAESRRLMLENIHTMPSQFSNCSFTVNIRTPSLGSAGQVRLKPRELGPPLVFHWDDKLTLEFNGSHPSLCSLEITKADDAVTVFLAGDSTVTDQPQEPWNSWGQMLPLFLNSGVAIANHAESGESMPSFLGAKRLDKILNSMKKGDYLFIQFGHNDQKDKRPGSGAFTTYKTNLVRFVSAARSYGGLPVLVTPMERKAGVTNATLGDFPAAVRQVAQEENVPLIDLNAMSKILYAALGESLGRAFQDGTHHNNYGSYELARCVVEGIKANNLPLAKYLREGVTDFDPKNPNSVGAFAVPPSPSKSLQKPDGN